MIAGDTYTILEWEWDPDPDVIAAQLLKLADDLSNWAEPLVQSRNAFITDTETRFETKLDPYGIEWEPLSADYEARKIRQGYLADDILIRDGDLKRAAISPTNWIVGDRGVFFKYSGLPFYGPYHQFGADHLPQRMFIGASEETELAIEDIFVDWVDKVIDQDFKPRAFNPLGQGFQLTENGRFSGVESINP